MFSGTALILGYKAIRKMSLFII